jgi:hypothetical protein
MMATVDSLMSDEDLIVDDSAYQDDENEEDISNYIIPFKLGFYFMHVFALQTWVCFVWGIRSILQLMVYEAWPVPPASKGTVLYVLTTIIIDTHICMIRFEYAGSRRSNDGATNESSTTHGSACSCEAETCSANRLQRSNCPSGYHASSRCNSFRGHHSSSNAPSSNAARGET